MKYERENKKMSYKRFNILDANLEKGMIVEGKISKIKPYGAFIELKSRN